MTIQRDLANISKELMWKFPFYGYFLLTLNKLERSDIPTAGVCKRGINLELAINPDYWNSLSQNHKIGLLCHEVKHIAFLHLNMRDGFSDKKLFNIAADAMLHETHDKTWIHDDWVTVEKLNKDFNLKLANHESTKYYYDELRKEQQQNPKGKFAKAMKDGTFGEMHLTWEEFEKLSETEKKMIQHQIEFQLKSTIESNQKLRGLVPAELKDLIDHLFEIKEPVLNWKAYMRRFMGSSQEVHTKKTRRKQSLRYPDQPGLKVKSKKRVLVGVDMSGSMSNDDIIEAFHEIHHIYKSGVAVDVMEVDAKVHDVYAYKGKWDGKVSGRGGTYMSIGIDYFNKNSKDYTTLIIITDGHIESPSEITRPLFGKKVLWVVSSNGTLNEDWPGSKIQIK